MSDESTSRAPAIVLVAVLLAIVVVVVIIFAYSTVNTPFSVDGDKAQYSRYLDSGE